MTMQIEGAAVRFLCDVPEHVQRSLVCTRAKMGYSAAESEKVEELKLDGVTVTHNWVPMKKEKPVPLEETTKPGGDMEFVLTCVPLHADRYYCVLYDHVKQKQNCAIYGYAAKPKEDTKGHHEPSAFKEGQRSAYVKYVDQNAADPENTAGENLVDTGEYLKQLATDVVDTTARVFEKPVEDAANPDVAKFQEQLQKNVDELVNEPILRKDYAGRIGFEMPLREGDWVLVRARLLSLGNDGNLTVEVKTTRNIAELVHPAPEEIICRTNSPVPDEPNVGHILRSDKTAELFIKAGGHWVSANGPSDNTKYRWDELWEQWGPFTEFYASRPVASR